MTKRLIEVDDAKIAEAKRILGTTTLKATVEAALDELAALDERRRSLLALTESADELTSDEERRAAWG